DFVATNGKRIEAGHQRADHRRGELRALRHGVQQPRAVRLDEDRVQDALVVRDQEEWPRAGDVVEPEDRDRPDPRPREADGPLDESVEDHRTAILGWNSMISPSPHSRYNLRSAAQMTSSQRRGELFTNLTLTTRPLRSSTGS